MIGGRAHCGACPQGYIGTGESACTPILTGLSVGNGVLSPTLDPNNTAYSLKVTQVTEPITLTPAAATGVDIQIAGVLVDSGFAWTEVIPKVGSSAITITLSRPGHPSRKYTIEILRDPDIAYTRRTARFKR